MTGEDMIRASATVTCDNVVMLSRSERVRAIGVERCRPLTRLRPGESFRPPNQVDAAVIESGTLKVELVMTSGSVLPLARFFTGDIVPALDHLSTPASWLSYRAEQPTTLFWLRGELSEASMRARIDGACETLMCASIRQITLLACLPVAYRLYVEILRNAVQAEYGPFKLPTHGELAGRVCATRETVSRELAILRHQGVLSKGRLITLTAAHDLIKRIARALQLDQDSDVWEAIGLEPPRSSTQGPTPAYSG